MITMGIGEAFLAVVMLGIWIDARPKVVAIRDILSEMKKMSES